jgi:hypothetical protein
VVNWPVRIGTFWPTDGGQFVIQRDHVRRRQDVGVAVRFQRVRQRAQSQRAADLLEHADRQAVAGQVLLELVWRLPAAMASGDIVVGAARGVRLQASHAVGAVLVAGSAHPLHAEFGALSDVTSTISDSM